MRHVSAARRLGLLAVIGAATACAPPPADAPPAAPRAAGVAKRSAAPVEALRLTAVDPPPGTPVPPRAHFRLAFDRDLDARTITRELAPMEYVTAPEGLLEDPFQYLAVSQRGVTPRELVLQPPELLPGTVVRLRLLPGLRGRDGSEMASSGEPVLDATWPVLELPP